MQVRNESRVDDSYAIGPPPVGERQRGVGVWQAMGIIILCGVWPVHASRERRKDRVENGMVRTQALSLSDPIGVLWWSPVQGW
jgi:hypothetical protein